MTQSSTSALGTSDLGNLAGSSPVAIDSASGDTAFEGTTGLSATTASFELQDKGSEPDTPVILDPYITRRDDGTLFMTYIKDTDPGSDVVPEIFLQSKNSTGDWNTPVQLTSDGQTKSTPTIGFADDGDPLVVWTQLTNSQEESIINQLLSSEIYWTCFDIQAGNAPVPIRLTNDNEADSGASAGVNGTGLLTGITSTALQVSGRYTMPIGRMTLLVLKLLLLVTHLNIAGA